MPVKTLKVEKRCKICTSPGKAAIDDLLEMRERRMKLDGQTVAQRHIFAKMKESGLENPTPENVRSHLRNHIEIVDSLEEAKADSEADARLKVVLDELGPDWEDRLLSLDEFLKFYVAIEARNLIRSYVASGNLQGAQLERLFKGAAEMTKRKQDGAAANLADLLAESVL